jgi:hypothetical protein
MSQPTPEHLAALAQGRAEGTVVRNYLTALHNTEAPKKGRQPRSADDIAKQINETTDPVERLKLRAALREAVARESRTSGVDFDALEKKFLEVVDSYSAKHGLTYADWRAEGVPAAVLKGAGITRKDS